MLTLFSLLELPEITGRVWREVANRLGNFSGANEVVLREMIKKFKGGL